MPQVSVDCRVDKEATYALNFKKTNSQLIL